ncbi:MAG: amidohydrolase family protein [Actinobacteria bacterium]|nr:amidohydrolase family protein [Actinomycetota bacterium]
MVQVLNSGEREGFDTRKHLENARRQAEERNYSGFVIVDADAHHYEGESWTDIYRYIEDPVLRHRALASDHSGGRGRPIHFEEPGRQSVAGRVRRYELYDREVTPKDVHRDAELSRRQRESIGLDYQIVFPTAMLELGMHPDPFVEVQLSWAYSRWLVENVTPHDPHMKTMIYLPFSDPEASLRAIEEFSDKPGVVGFTVTTTRYQTVHQNKYMPVYAALQERNLPLGFHASFYQRERLFEGMSQFLSVHALGFVFPTVVHATNMVINGIPERFPNLKVIWIESGLAWVPFLMQRLDNEYMMRTSEAPLLKKKPSEYLRENFYYATQPLEMDNMEALELTLNMINAETQLLFASDYPHWDFNLPSTIYDLPFLSEKAKRRILGENAMGVYPLEQA